jgi:antirestriction protein
MLTRQRNISNTANVIDLRDVTDRIEELENETSDGSEHDETADEFKALTDLLDDLCGNGGDHDWRGDWYPGSLIRDSYFVQAMRELCEDIGDFPNGVPSYYVIDWEATANNLRADYSSVEYDGETYWYR